MLAGYSLNDLGALWMGATVVLMLLVESRYPLVRSWTAGERWRHGVRNISIALAAALVVVPGGAVFFAIGVWNEAHRFGLLQHWDTPLWARFIVALVGIDFFDYLRHRLFHRIPILWRLHRVHHADRQVDTTTGILGHPVEGLISYVYFAVWLALLGVDAEAYVLRALVVSILIPWHHSNVALPARLDAVLSLVMPTPRTHRLHHSRDVAFTDSNFATVLTLWDRLFGTFRSGQRAPMPTGLDGFDGERTQSVAGLLTSPFRTITASEPATRSAAE